MAHILCVVAASIYCAAFIIFICYAICIIVELMLEDNNR